MLGNHFLPTRQNIPEKTERVSLREGGKCVVVKVWLWRFGQYADVLSRHLEFAHAIERVLEIMRSLQQCEELSPHTIICLGALFFSTRRLQIGPIFPRGSSVGPFWLFQQLLSFTDSNEAHGPHPFDKTPPGMCRIKAGEIVGSIIHLSFLEKGYQTANPLSEYLLGQRAQAWTTEVLGPNYRRERQSQNWLLIELPGWMLMQPQRNIIYPDKDATETKRTGGLGLSRHKLYICLRIHMSCNMCFDSSAVVKQLAPYAP